MKKLDLKVTGVTFSILLASLMISWFFSSYFFEILTMDYQAPDLINSDKREIQKSFIIGILTWETLVDASMFYLINFLPLIVVLPTLNLFNVKRVNYQIGKNRYLNLSKEIKKKVLYYSFLSAGTASLAFSVFYSIGGLFVYRSIENIGGYSFLYPNNFYINHPYLFFISMVWTIYFAAFFVLSFITCGLVLYYQKVYQVLGILFLICFGVSSLSNIIGLPIINIYSAFTSYNTQLKTYESFVSVVLFGIIGQVLFFIGKTKVQCFYEAN